MITIIYVWLGFIAAVLGALQFVWRTDCAYCAVELDSPAVDGSRTRKLCGECAARKHGPLVCVSNQDVAADSEMQAAA